MRKPTVFQFFGFEIAVWIAIIVWLIWSDNSEKISVVNLSVAAFNMIGMFITLATDWAPWRETD
jgi:hypothetical protein